MLTDAEQLGPSAASQEAFERDVLSDVHLLRRSRFDGLANHTYGHVVLALTDLQKTGSSQLESLLNKVLEARRWEYGNSSRLERWRRGLDPDPAILGRQCGLSAYLSGEAVSCRQRATLYGSLRPPQGWVGNRVTADADLGRRHADTAHVTRFVQQGAERTGAPHVDVRACLKPLPHSAPLPLAASHVLTRRSGLDSSRLRRSSSSSPCSATRPSVCAANGHISRAESLATEAGGGCSSRCCARTRRLKTRRTGACRSSRTRRGRTSRRPSTTPTTLRAAARLGHTTRRCSNNGRQCQTTVRTTA